MEELTAAREIIDACDREMAALFEKRMAAAKSIALYKIEHGLPICVPEREQAVLKKNTALIHDAELHGYYIQFLQQIMDISKNYQEKLISDETEVRS